MDKNLTQYYHIDKLSFYIEGECFSVLSVGECAIHSINIEREIKKSSAIIGKRLYVVGMDAEIKAFIPPLFLNKIQGLTKGNDLKEEIEGIRPEKRGEIFSLVMLVSDNMENKKELIALPNCQLTNIFNIEIDNNETDIEKTKLSLSIGLGNGYNYYLYKRNVEDKDKKIIDKWLYNFDKSDVEKGNI